MQYFITEGKEGNSEHLHHFLRRGLYDNFKPRSKVVLEELDSVRDPQETPNVPPLFPIDVQKGEYVQHVPESKQTQETT